MTQDAFSTIQAFERLELSEAMRDRCDELGIPNGDRSAVIEAWQDVIPDTRVRERLADQFFASSVKERDENLIWAMTEPSLPIGPNALYISTVLAARNGVDQADYEAAVVEASQGAVEIKFASKDLMKHDPARWRVKFDQSSKGRLRCLVSDGDDADDEPPASGGGTSSVVPYGIVDKIINWIEKQAGKLLGPTWGKAFGNILRSIWSGAKIGFSIGYSWGKWAAEPAGEAVGAGLAPTNASKAQVKMYGAYGKMVGGAAGGYSLGITLSIPGAFGGLLYGIYTTATGPSSSSSPVGAPGGSPVMAHPETGAGDVVIGPFWPGAPKAPNPRPI